MKVILWRPISWRARKTHVTRDVGAQACVKTHTMIFANVRLVFVRAFSIKSALLETGHVSRSQTVCLVSKRYNTVLLYIGSKISLRNWATLQMLKYRVGNISVTNKKIC